MVDRESNLDRRTMLRTAVTGTAVAGLSACSGSGSSGTVTTTSAAAGTGQASAGVVLGATADIPVGGGKVFADQKVVVTCPTAGTYKGFSSTCTHQGCQVGQVQDGVIQCPCHGSQFNATDGSVKSGPATSPLPAVAITVRDNQIVLGS